MYKIDRVSRDIQIFEDDDFHGRGRSKQRRPSAGGDK